jgi:hypothetical protein
MEVAITGNALAVNPIAQPDTICSGNTIQLFAQASGGAGNLFYNFTWTSQPPGFTSEEKNPNAQPAVNTVYTVVLNDGYKQVGGSVAVIVHPTPVIDIGPDAIVCVFETQTLDAGNEGCYYLWSNGSTERTFHVGTTGIGFDIKTIWVTVTSPEGCVATGQRTLIFDFAACNGIDEPVAESGFHIYPNPGNGMIHIENESGLKNCLLNITDIFGREVLKNQEIIFSGTEKTFKLNLESYPPGLYLIRISANGKYLVAMKYLLKS